MKRRFALLFGFLCFIESRNIVKNEERSFFGDFKQDFLKIFPHFDFSDKDLHSIISFFRVVVSRHSLNRIFKELDVLQDKYGQEFIVLSKIFFFKFVLSYAFKDIKKYSDVNQHYSKFQNKDFADFNNIIKIMYLFKDWYYSNSSDYCISIKQKDYSRLCSLNANDEYIDLSYKLMLLKKELLSLDFLLKSLESSYGVGWIESLWYSVNLIKNHASDNMDIDVYYYHIIEFLCSQGLEEKAWPLYQELCKKIPDSPLIATISKFFENY